MTNSEQVAAQLNELLADRLNSVVALSGAWGTGKTHLWRTVVSPKHQKPRPPLYISLFGLGSTGDIQAEILQAAITSDDPALRDKQQRWYSAAGLGLRVASLGWLKNALDALAALSLPALMKERLLVFDDIERKHSNLDIEAILGLIDRYRQLFGARFLLILNRGRLEDEEIWSRYLEKVIDHSVTLSPTPEEAFDVAVSDVPCKHRDALRKVSVRLGLTNIRVIQKILRIASTVLNALPELPDKFLDNVVPSLVLLPAIYFEAATELPPMSFVLSSPHISFGKEKPSPDQVKWSKLLADIGIIAADDFEKALLDYLELGLFRADVFKRIVSGYVEGGEKENFQARLRLIFHDVAWNAAKSKADLCADIRRMLPHIGKLAAASVTALSQEAESLGDHELSDQLIEEWIAAYREWAAAHQVPQANSLETFGQSIDTRIAGVMAQLRAEQYPPMDLLETLKRMTGGWGDREIQSLKAATAQEYMGKLQSLGADDLAYFVSKHFDWLLQPAYQNADGISHAVALFVEASRAIINGSPEGRLAEILRGQFAARGRSSDLMTPLPGSAPVEFESIDREGKINRFAYVIQDNSLNEEWAIYAYPIPRDSESLFEIRLKRIEPQIARQIMINHYDHPEFKGKGIADVLLPALAKRLDVEIQSSGVKETGDGRNGRATKMWRRLVEKGIAVYAPHEDLFRIPRPSSKP